MPNHIKMLGLLFLEALAVSSFLFFETSLEKMFVLFVCSVVVLSIFLFLLVKRYARALASRTEESSAAVKSGIVLSLSPFILLLIVPIQNMVYLKNIRNTVLVLSIAGFLYLHVQFLSRIRKRSYSKPLSSLISKWLSPEKHKQRQISLVIFILTLLFYTFFASGVVFLPYPLTGDEPHYLLITKSLISDGDINLLNNYQNQDYLEFYQGKLDSHARPGKTDSKSRYSRHLPALPIFLAPAYFAGSKAGGIIASLSGKPSHQRKVLTFAVRFLMSVLAAAFCGLFYLTVFSLFKRPLLALFSWAVFAFSSPLLFYSHKIYPEIPVSLVLLWIFWLLITKKEWTALHSVLVGTGICILPWLGIKYAVLSLAVFLVCLYVFRKNKRNGKAFFFLVLPNFFSLALLLYYLWILYGNLSPLSIYKGSLLSRAQTFSPFFHFNVAEFFRCGVGYLMDQRAGLFVYAPVYLLFIPGLILWTRKDKTNALSSLFLLVSYWAFCSLSFYWGGYCPPGRTLLPVVWIMALCMASALSENQKITRILTKHFLTFFSFLISFVLLKNTWLLYHENLSFSWSERGKFSHLLTFLGNPFTDLTKLVPSLSSKQYLVWKPLVFWIPAVFLVAYIFLKKRKKLYSLTLLQRMSAHSIFVIVLSSIIILFTFLHIRLDPERSYKTESCQVYFQDHMTFGPELEGFWVKGRSSTHLVAKTPTKVSQLILVLSSPVEGKTVVQVGNSRKTVFRRKNRSLKKAAVFLSPVGFPAKDGYLYTVMIEEKSGFVPSELDPASNDNRFLGVFVHIHTE